VVEYSGTPNDSKICAGDVALLSAMGGTVQNWSTGATSQSITVNPTSVGSHEYWAIIIVNGTCPTMISVTIQVVSAPFSFITVIENSGIPNDHSVCKGSSAVLTANGSGGSGSYLWSTGATTQSITVSPIHTTMYGLTVTTPNGCPSVSNATVVVSPSPIAEIIDPNMGNNCSGGILIVDTGGECPASIEWSPTWDSDVWTNITTSGLYSVTITDENGCTASDSYQVNGTTPPIANFAFGTNWTTATFQNLSQNATSYSWNFGDGYTSLDFNPTHTYSNGGTFKVTLAVSNSCGSDYIEKFVTVEKPCNPPVANFSFTNGQGCGPLNVAFNNASSGDIDTYQWNFPGGEPATFSGPNPPLIEYKYKGTYTVSLTVTNECGSNTFTVPNCIQVTGLTPVVDAGPDIVVCCPALGVTLDFYTDVHNYASIWFPSTWMDNQYHHNPHVTPPTTTTYHVYVTPFDGGCIGHDSVKVIIPGTVASEEINATSILVLPTLLASNKVIEVSVPAELNMQGKYKVIIFDMSGKEVRSWDKENKEFSIPIDDFPAGQYTLNIGGLGFGKTFTKQITVL